jgi:hypothetical protein
MTRVALLWHMHQPYYEDLVTREHILPWVRMHALKDYYGMVALLEEFPQVRLTFNLVPSLLVQLEAFAGNRAHDRYLELGLKAGDTLGRDEVLFVLRHFFHAQRERMIDIYPRYAELLRLRGDSVAAPDLEAAARRFSPADLRDLQVWQKLAWVDPYYLDRDPRIRALVAKGRAFDEGDKATLRAVELEILNAVIPAYRARGGGADRDLGLALLPSDPAAALRHRRLQADASAQRHAAAAVRPSRGRARAVRTRGAVSRAAVRRPSSRPVAVGRIGLRRDGTAGGAGGIPVDGDR